MKLGILSDSHDNLVKIEQAVRFFNKHNVYFVLHAGDFIAPFTIPRLNDLSCEWKGVFGNNDGEKIGLAGASEGKIEAGPLRIELTDRKILLVHDCNTINQKEEQVDLIVFGHTHKAEITNQGAKLLVNPGECGGWLTGESTVMIVDLVSLSAQIFKI
jgi:putative phosphoesterase